MKIPKDATVKLEAAEGTITLTVQSSIKTKGDALLLSAAIRQMANNLPERLAIIQKPKVKAKPSARTSRVAGNSDAAATQTPAE